MVDPMNGELVLVRSLDFETRNAYSLRTTVMDGGDPTFSDSALVNISVQDINDNTPLFNASSYTAEVNEGNYTTTPLRIVTVRHTVREGEWHRAITHLLPFFSSLSPSSSLFLFHTPSPSSLPLYLPSRPLLLSTSSTSPLPLLPFLLPPLPPARLVPQMLTLVN